MAFVTSGGWALGTTIRSWAPGTGLLRFGFECALWLMVVAMIIAPLAQKSLRDRLIAKIPK